MANTLKFGNENWATKKDSILAYNDENANFKPLPFVTSRASTATRVNKLGLIEKVAVGIPRVDYLENTKGAYLLEPVRTNLITYSEDFSQWTNSNSFDLSNQIISPNGTLNADKLITNNGSINGQITKTLTKSASAITYNYSVFAKKGEWNRCNIYVSDSGSFSNRVQFFVDLETGNVIQATTAGAFSSAIGSSENYGNGWYRFSVKFTTGTETAITVRNYSIDSVATNGDGTSGVYIYGAQLEEASYPTSYIPTSGSAITRLADTASQTVPDGIIGQTVGGVVYMDFIAQNSQGLSQSHFWMGSLGSEIGVYGSNPLIFYSSGGVSIQGANLVTGERYKIALAFETNDYAAYVNGVQIGVDLSATYPNMSSIYLNAYNNGTEIQKKKINDFRLYNTRLSNSELATLTTI